MNCHFNEQCSFYHGIILLLPRRQKKNPVDFDDELKIGDVMYDNMT